VKGYAHNRLLNYFGHFNNASGSCSVQLKQEGSKQLTAAVSPKSDVTSQKDGKM